MKTYKHWLLGLIFLIGGCDTNAVFKEIYDIEGGKWYVTQVPSFTFQIQDTTATYSVYYNVRNSASYPYYNLYVRRNLVDSTKKNLESRLDQLILLDPKTGKPYGDGLGDLFDHKIKVASQYRFPHAGTYTLQLRQYMRQNPLPEIYSIGISVEKDI
jgi:gliding motility-associated lipoprotein GldH